MDLDSGPERTVCVPGDRAREESRDVANVRVTKGLEGGDCVWLSRRKGSMRVEWEEEKVNASRILEVMMLV